MSRHPALEETQQYLHDELAYLRGQVLERAQQDLDDLQAMIDRMRAELAAWHAR